jgi:hypothetical protein
MLTEENAPSSNVFTLTRGIAEYTQVDTTVIALMAWALTIIVVIRLIQKWTEKVIVFVLANHSANLALIVPATLSMICYLLALTVAAAFVYFFMM